MISKCILHTLEMSLVVGHQGSSAWQVLPDKFGTPYPAECRHYRICATDGSGNLVRMVTSTECCAAIWNRRYCVSLPVDCVVAVAAVAADVAVADGTAVVAYCGGVAAVGADVVAVADVAADGVVAPA